MVIIMVVVMEVTDVTDKSCGVVSCREVFLVFSVDIFIVFSVDNFLVSIFTLVFLFIHTCRSFRSVLHHKCRSAIFANSHCVRCSQSIPCNDM